MKNSALCHTFIFLNLKFKERFSRRFSLDLCGSQAMTVEFFGANFCLSFTKRQIFVSNEGKAKINFQKIRLTITFRLDGSDRFSSALEKTFNQRCFSEKILFIVLVMRRKKKLCLPKPLKHRTNFFCEWSDYTLNFPTIKHFFDFEEFREDYSGTNSESRAAVRAANSIAALVASVSEFPTLVITRTIAPSERRRKRLSKIV